MIPYAMLTHPERLAIQMREAKMLEDIRARWDARTRTPYHPDGWSHYDREASRSGHAGFDREDYGL
jgi:hypothetical protein